MLAKDRQTRPASVRSALPPAGRTPAARPAPGAVRTPGKPGAPASEGLLAAAVAGTGGSWPGERRSRPLPSASPRTAARHDGGKRRILKSDVQKVLLAPAGDRPALRARRDRALTWRLSASGHGRDLLGRNSKTRRHGYRVHNTWSHRLRHGLEDAGHEQGGARPRSGGYGLEMRRLRQRELDRLCRQRSSTWRGFSRSSCSACPGCRAGPDPRRPWPQGKMHRGGTCSLRTNETRRSPGPLRDRCPSVQAGMPPLDNGLCPRETRSGPLGKRSGRDEAGGQRVSPLSKSVIMFAGSDCHFGPRPAVRESCRSLASGLAAGRAGLGQENVHAVSCRIIC